MTKQPNIISVSRRSDIPATHTEWFNECLKQGSVTVPNVKHPGSKVVSLKKNDVACFVFWSKDFTRFLETLYNLRDTGYRSYFNYTLTLLPKTFETKVNHNNALSSLRVISRMYSPAHINWRYDPILFSDITTKEWHINNFTALCSSLQGYVERCYINFPVLYGKVQVNLQAFTRKTGIKVYNPDAQTRAGIITQLYDIAQARGITLLSCAESHGLDTRVKRAHCIDADQINQLYNLDQPQNYRPSRDGCGCSHSIDIGTYNTCNHGCIYCYANTSSHTILQALSA